MLCARSMLRRPTTSWWSSRSATGCTSTSLSSSKSPRRAYLFAGVEAAVSVGFLEDETLAFYRQVLQNGAFLEPFEATFGKQMSLINCQGLFLKALAHYVKTQCTRLRSLDQRVERTVVKMLARDGITEPTPEDVDARRQRARAFLEPSQSIIDHFAHRSLSGASPVLPTRMSKNSPWPGRSRRDPAPCRLSRSSIVL